MGALTGVSPLTASVVLGTAPPVSTGFAVEEIFSAGTPTSPSPGFMPAIFSVDPAVPPHGAAKRAQTLQLRSWRPHDDCIMAVGGAGHCPKVYERIRVLWNRNGPALKHKDMSHSRVQRS